MILFISMLYHQLYSQETKKYWVFFVDKGIGIPAQGQLMKSSSSYRLASDILSERALKRRSKSLVGNGVIDAQDVPLYKPYLDKMKEQGAILSQQSRWMNAASFGINSEYLSSIKQMPFVKSISPIIVHKKNNSSLSNLKLAGEQQFASAEYGQSYEQVNMVNAVPLHEIGISGDGVLVGMLDSGFRWRLHEALQSRNVIAEYDFIFHDSVTANQSNDAGNQDAHGTLTMSVLGGYKAGKIISPAYGVQFVLAKTEYIPTETTFEEDTWTAGIEWLEAMGADVVSSSLGYNDFQDIDTGYTWEHGDFDGHTTVTAKAALRAARLGVLVCNSMGNEGNGDGIHGTMLTPADADSILSVGAMNFNKSLASYSSTGPTNDGRIKPDIVAPGTSVFGASTAGRTAYKREQGTSLSTPLVAGCAALVLCARPELTAQQAIDAMKNSASHSNTSGYTFFPNNFLGSGLVDAFNAALTFGPIFSSKPTIKNSNTGTTVSVTVVSKFGIKPDSVFLQYYDGDYSSSSNGYQTLQMHLEQSKYFASSGLYTATLSGLHAGFHAVFHIEAKDSAGNTYSNPSPFYEKDWEMISGTSLLRMLEIAPANYALMQNYPNPFNSQTTINIKLPKAEWATIALYSSTGQLIRTMMNGYSLPGAISMTWDGNNEQGTSVASGMYFVRLETPSYSSTKKMVLLR